MTMVSSESNPPVGNLNGGEIYLPESSVDGSNPGLELLPVPLPKVGGDDDFSHRRNSRVNEGSSPEKQSGSGSVFSAFFFFTVIHLWVGFLAAINGTDKDSGEGKDQSTRDLTKRHGTWCRAKNSVLHVLKYL